MTSQRERLLNLSPKSLDEIYGILADIYARDPETLKTITAHPFLYIRNMISKAEAKGVLLHNLGSFETYLVSVNREIRQILTAYRKGKLTRVQTVNYITKLWKLRKACQRQAVNYIEKYK